MPLCNLAGDRGGAQASVGGTAIEWRARLITLSREAVAERAERDSPAAAPIAATEVAEVAHEALFRHWGTLREWLEQGREHNRFQRRVRAAAAHWVELGQPGCALWQPPDLDLLTQFLEHGKEDLSSLDLEFYRQSARQERARRMVRAALRRRQRAAT